MKLVQKVLFSLLLATVIFTAFAVAAYSGLFRFIDDRFYNQRVRDSAQSILREAQDEATRYQSALQEEVGTLADLPAIRNVFLINQSRQDTEEQARAIGSFFETHPEIDYIRIIDNERGNLWFSTLESDVRERSATRIEYIPVADLDPPLLPPSAAEEGQGASWVPERGGLRLTAPVIDNFGIPQGLIIVWATTNGLFTNLVSDGILGPSTRVRLTPSGALVFNAPRHFDAEDLAVVDQYVAGDSLGILESDVGAAFAVETLTREASVPPSVYLIPETDLHMDDSLRWILMGAVFIVTFLIVYLILNIRQDPDIIVAERFRRFQQSILKDYLREGRAIAPDVWQHELDNRKEKIAGELRKGLGKLNDETRTKLEQNMDRNWDELYRLMGNQGTAARAELEPVSLQQIEAIIERTLARHGEMGPPTRSHAPAAPPSRPRSRPADDTAGMTPVEVEDVEDLEELDDLEAAEPVEAEEVGELEDAGELEELDDLEEAEPVEAEEVSELEDAGELEELDDLEEAEPVEAEEVSELEDAGELEELGELEDAEDLEEAEPVEAEEVGELEETEELEELGELEDAEDLEEAEPVEAEEVGELEDAGELEELDDLEEAEPVEAEEAAELEDAEELEELGELEDAEALEELNDLEEAEPLEAEEVAELEDAEELEELGELEDAEDLEEADPVEAEEIGELEETEELEEFGELEDAEDLEEAEPVEAEEGAELEETEELEELDELEDLEELGDLEDAEALEELNDLEEAEPVGAEEAAELEETEELEELGDLEDLEELGELEEAESFDAEEVAELEETEELEELGDLEDAEDLEELGELEDAEALEELDDLEEAEPVEAEEGAELEETEELEELDDLEEAESLDAEEVAELEELEDFGELEDAEDLEEAEPVEAEEGAELEGTEELEELDDLEEAESLDAEEVAELEELEDFGELEDAEDLEEAEPLDAEEVAELEDAEELEELGELEDAEALEELDDLEEAEPLEAEEVAELEDAQLRDVDGADRYIGDILVEDDVSELVPETEWVARQHRETIEETQAEEDVEAVEEPVLDVAATFQGDHGAPAEADWFQIETTLLEMEDDDSDILAGVEEIASIEPTEEAAELAAIASQEEIESVEELESLEEVAAVSDEVSDLEEIDDDLASEDEFGVLEDFEPVEAMAVEEEVEALDVVEEAEVLDELSGPESLEDDEPVQTALHVEGPRQPFLSAASSFGGSFVKPIIASEEGGDSTYIPVSRPKDSDTELVAIWGLENSNAYQVVELDDFIAFAGKSHSVIEERDGLAQIQATAYFDDSSEIDQRILSLAEQVLHRQTIGGIEDVMGTAFDDLDFGDLFGTETTTVVSRSMTESSAMPLKFASGGFELASASDTGDAGVRQVYRELVGLTRRWDARVAAILEPRDDGLVGSFTLGMPAECQEHFEIDTQADLVQNVCSFRRVALLKQRLGMFRDFASSCHARKLASVSSWLFLPLNMKTGAYLMIGFQRGFEDLLDLTTRYEIVSRAG